MKHELKTWPEPFRDARREVKTFEVRRNDRVPPFAIGDVLRLNEWVPDEPDACRYDVVGLAGKYTGSFVEVEVTYILRGQYGLPSDLVVMSIRRTW